MLRGTQCKAQDDLLFMMGEEAFASTSHHRINWRWWWGWWKNYPVVASLLRGANHPWPPPTYLPTYSPTYLPLYRGKQRWVLCLIVCFVSLLFCVCKID